MICGLCPRECRVERDVTYAGGYCGMPSEAMVARVMIHRWEEPCLTGLSIEDDACPDGDNRHTDGGNCHTDGGGKYTGAGAVFFSGCNLGCVYCQNRAISWGGVGKRVTVEGLRDIFRGLIVHGAACLDLVTPTQFTPVIWDALGEESWPVPVVWNSSGYEKPETLRLLRGRIQIYMPDLKYASGELAGRYSGASDYFEWATAAIEEMYRQTGPYRMEDGLLKSGVLIRHLILPGEIENTRRVIDWVSGRFHRGEILFSLMGQYTPPEDMIGDVRKMGDVFPRIPRELTSEEIRRLSRRVHGGEYRTAVGYMVNSGVTDGYTQSLDAATAEYTPEFDLTGVL